MIKTKIKKSYKLSFFEDFWPQFFKLRKKKKIKNQIKNIYLKKICWNYNIEKQKLFRIKIFKLNITSF